MKATKIKFGEVIRQSSALPTLHLKTTVFCSPNLGQISHLLTRAVEVAFKTLVFRFFNKPKNLKSPDFRFLKVF